MKINISQSTEIIKIVPYVYVSLQTSKAIRASKFLNNRLGELKARSKKRKNNEHIRYKVYMMAVPEFSSYL